MYLYNPLHYCHTKSLQNILNLWLIPNYHIWDDSARKHVQVSCIMYFMSAPYQHTSNVKPEQTQNTDTLPPLFRLGNFQNKHRPIQSRRIISFQQTSPSYRVVVIAQQRFLPLVSSGLAVSVRIRGYAVCRTAGRALNQRDFAKFSCPALLLRKESIWTILNWVFNHGK